MLRAPGICKCTARQLNGLSCNNNHDFRVHGRCSLRHISSPTPSPFFRRNLRPCPKRTIPKPSGTRHINVLISRHAGKLTATYVAQPRRDIGEASWCGGGRCLLGGRDVGGELRGGGAGLQETAGHPVVLHSKRDAVVVRRNQALRQAVVPAPHPAPSRCFRPLHPACSTLTSGMQ